MTKKQKEKEKKKELDEEMEYLRQVEVPESQGGGRKYVRDKRRQEEKKEKKEKDTAKNYLDSKKKHLKSYVKRLAEYGRYCLDKQEFDKDWEYYSVPTHGKPINIFGRSFSTKPGVLFIVKSPKGKVFCKGIAPTLNPEYDIPAINTLVVQVENTMDSEKGILLSDKKTDSGIILPN